MLSRRTPRFMQRAVSAFLTALLVFVVSSPLLAQYEPAITCSVPCCVKERRCCCKTRVAGTDQKQKKHDAIAQDEIGRTCPAGCAGSCLSTNLFLRDSIRAAEPAPRTTADIVEYHQQITPEDLIALGSSPPRAPPLS